MDKYIFLEPNSKPHQTGKVSIVVVCASSSSLALNNNEAGQQFFGFSQCSVIIKAGKPLLLYFTWSKLIPTPVREGSLAGVL